MLQPCRDIFHSRGHLFELCSDATGSRADTAVAGITHITRAPPPGLMPGEEVRVPPRTGGWVLHLLPLSETEAVRIRPPPPEVKGLSAETHGQVIVPPARAPYTSPDSSLSPGASPDVRQGGGGAQGRLIAGTAEPPGKNYKYNIKTWQVDKVFLLSSSSNYLGSGGKRTFLLRPAPESLNDWDLLTFVLFPGSCRESPLIDHSP